MYYLFVLFLLLSASNGSANNCIKIKSAYDIGSGSTKIKVAKVDVCVQKIMKILFDKSVKVDYKQALKEAKDNSLNSKILAQGLSSLKSLKKQAMAYSPQVMSAVATSAFRTAANGTQAAQSLSKALGFEIKVITQEEEAKLGFIGASAISKSKDIKNVVVWDIGGGSMQLTSYNSNKEFLIYKGQVASVSFKNYIIDVVQNRKAVPKKWYEFWRETPRKFTNPKSPNPMSLADQQSAFRYIKNEVVTKIDQKLIKKISNPKTMVIGIGGVHYYSIAKNISKTKIYNYKMLMDRLNAVKGKDDKQLGNGKYVATDISNLVLVAAFMKNLKINSIRAAKINLADSLLLKSN